LATLKPDEERCTGEFRCFHRLDCGRYYPFRDVLSSEPSRVARK